MTARGRHDVAGGAGDGEVACVVEGLQPRSRGMDAELAVQV